MLERPRRPPAMAQRLDVPSAWRASKRPPSCRREPRARSSAEELDVDVYGVPAVSKQSVSSEPTRPGASGTRHAGQEQHGSRLVWSVEHGLRTDRSASGYWRPFPSSAPNSEKARGRHPGHAMLASCVVKRRSDSHPEVGANNHSQSMLSLSERAKARRGAKSESEPKRASPEPRRQLS